MQEQAFTVTSPGGQVTVTVSTGAEVRWAVAFAGQPVLLASPLALALAGGERLGQAAVVLRSQETQVDESFAAIHYRKARVRDHYSLLQIEFAGDFALEFRAYDDAAAYRFVLARQGELVVQDETAGFHFAGDYPACIPYLRDYREGQVFVSSFESEYSEHPLSAFLPDALAMTPLLLDLGGGKKAVVLEADLEDYPGMYLEPAPGGAGLRGRFAPYPLEFRLGGFGGINQIPTLRAEWIARIQGPRALPWRALAFAERDCDLLNNDIVQKLAAPPRLDDFSWVQVGQVSWDWWHDYSLTGVDFVAGMNTPTFQYHIDFAAANGAKYIILDAGWSELLDLNQVNPEVDLAKILAYGKSKDVGVILWASWYAITQQMTQVFPKYAAMGVKGWKIDFLDRDDQPAVASTYAIAALAAQYRMLVDYHGVFKPTGLQRTYPNVVGYEGVYGMENYKWADSDAPRYAVTIPYTRNMAGPMDYTSGAMTNATQADFKARNHAPMSKGTRCHQLAQYVVFEAPLCMLSDSPTAYMREQECTDFLTAVPTFFDETVALDGSVGEFVAVARRKGSTWFVGAMTNWEARDLTLDFRFLEPGMYWAVEFCDGVNAHRDACDYRREEIHIVPGERRVVHLSNGGGWAARIERIA